MLVTDVSYLGSQPWPFPRSLMVGLRRQGRSRRRRCCPGRARSNPRSGSTGRRSGSCSAAPTTAGSRRRRHRRRRRDDAARPGVDRPPDDPGLGRERLSRDSGVGPSDKRRPRVCRLRRTRVRACGGDGGPVGRARRRAARGGAGALRAGLRAGRRRHREDPHHHPSDRASGRPPARTRSSEILAVTFTTRAAGEMRVRLRSLGVAGVQARTFHSAALKQLRYFWPRSVGGALWPVLEHKLRLVAIAARRANAGTDAATLRDLASEIEWAKATLAGPDGLPGRGRQAPAGHPAAAPRPSPRSSRSTSRSRTRPSSWTSTICCCTPARSWRTTRRSPASSVPGTGVSWSTSTRT